MINVSFKEGYKSQKNPSAAGIDPTRKNIWSESAKEIRFTNSFTNENYWQNKKSVLPAAGGKYKNSLHNGVHEIFFVLRGSYL